MTVRVVAAAEARADLRQRGLGEVAREVHGDVPRVGHVLGAAVAAQVVDVQAELAGDLGLHHLDGDRVLVGLGEDVLEGLLGDLERDLACRGWRRS